MAKPQIGELWEVTVTNREAARVFGTHLCRVEIVPSWGSIMFVRNDTGQPHLEFGDSLIESARLIYPTSQQKSPTGK